MTKIRRLSYTAICIALGIVLPMLFHAIPNGGQVFLPMHIPVLLCGLAVGPLYGLAAGLLTPALSCVLTGMPLAAMLPGMMLELAMYGLIGGWAMARLPIANPLGRTVAALLAAMLAGRLAGGLLNALVLKAGSYSLQAFVTGYFLTGLPGIAIQAVLIPTVMTAMQKAGIIKDAGGTAD